jgi:hypothetical protein
MVTDDSSCTWSQADPSTVTGVFASVPELSMDARARVVVVKLGPIYPEGSTTTFGGVGAVGSSDPQPAIDRSSNKQMIE